MPLHSKQDFKKNRDSLSTQVIDAIEKYRQWRHNQGIGSMTETLDKKLKGIAKQAEALQNKPHKLRQILKTELESRVYIPGSMLHEAFSRLSTYHEKPGNTAHRQFTTPRTSTQITENIHIISSIRSPLTIQKHPPIPKKTPEITISQPKNLKN